MSLGFSLEPQPRLIQTISQMLNPQMLSMLHLFNLPYWDLLNEINQQVTENPLLELKKPDELVKFFHSLKPKEKETGSLTKDTASYSLDNIAVSKEATLEQFLIEQLNLAQLKPKDYQVGLELINYIDDKGYLPDYFQIRHQITEKLEVSRQKVDQVLKIIQGFEPDGVAARNLKECLLLQLKSHNFTNEELENLLEKTIEEHLDLVAQKDSAKLAQALAIEQGALEIISFIEHNLNPHPALQFTQTNNQNPPVIPSFEVSFDQDEIKITCLEEQYGPTLTFNQEYLKILESGKADEKTLEFIREKLKNAELFLKNIERRKNTLQNIVSTICQHQKKFLAEGIAWLEPLPQKKLAEILDLDASIISRALAHKYIQTPKGVFNLKFLCPREISGVTPQKIKSMIASLAAGSPDQKRISDEKISELLHQKSINISRRTVTKYRLELKLPSSHKK